MLQYWLWLTTRRGLNLREAYLVTRHFPTPEAAYFADLKAYEEIEGLRSVRPLLDKELELPEQILSDCCRKGISLLTYQDAAYPQRLKNIYDPPLVLYYRGSLPDLNGPAMAVVGTRKASAYGLLHAKRLSYALSRSGCMVVSGGALGVDASAMEGALTGGSPVVGVLGCGVDILYPRQNRGILEDTVQYGCLLSEYPPGTEVRPEHFPVRNRIISGLSLGVLVIEAPDRSGAMITARAALEQGRDVFTIPANLGVSTCSGNFQLLRDGAILVRDVWDILQEYVPVYPELSCGKDSVNLSAMDPTPVAVEVPPEPPKKRTGLKDIWKRLTGLSPQEEALVRLLADGPKLVDNLAEEMELPAGQLMAILTMLEVKGTVRRLSVGEYALTEGEK